MSKIAIIKTGGKQYKVKEGDTLKVEKLKGRGGDKLKFSEVLLVAEEKTRNVQIGQPLLQGVEVAAEILEQAREKKITVMKYKAKTRYRKKYGHRQPYTKVKIERIGELSELAN